MTNEKCIEINDIEDSPEPKSRYELSKKEQVMAYIALGILVVTLFVVSLLMFNSPVIPEPFVTVQTAQDYKIVYDRETKVMYSMATGKYNAGQLSELYNPDHSLKIYKGK